ncbi:NUDIX domain-containing protein [Paenibacillus sp. GCM10012306]|uniref:NUDIX domain-containing protein n=1 Tax=Paenibacillus sp. GCM10012306 TaxID=3317342 RepID=UPI00360CF198
MQVKFYDLNTIDDSRLKYAVIFARYQNKSIYVKHKERNTWEIPGGRREINEDIHETARRELYEETGALTFNIAPLLIYSVTNDNSEETFGGLYYSEVTELGDLMPESEIGEICFLEELPRELTYPVIQSELHRRAIKELSSKKNFDIALGQFVAKLKMDKAIVAAIAYGSYVSGTLWKRSDIDLILVVNDEKTAFDFRSFLEHGIIINALVFSRMNFKKKLQSLVQGDDFHSLIHQSRLLYTTDPSMETYFSDIQEMGDNDIALQLAIYGINAVAGYYKTLKTLTVLKDFSYGYYKMGDLIDNIAHLVVIMNGKVPLQKVVLQAKELEPELFDVLYTRFIRALPDEAQVTSVMETIYEFLVKHNTLFFHPILQFLQETGMPQPVSYIHEQLLKRTDVSIPHFLEACEWLSDLNMITRVPHSIRLTSRSRVEVDEPAYVLVQGGII